MDEQIEIYVRNSGGKTLLNFYVPKAMRERFIKGLEEGQLEVGEIQTHLELVVLQLGMAQLVLLETAINTTSFSWR